MRLTKIKLAGFKSFVDPTTFYLPGNLVAIVGPNGCGKSNVIDAVRWVMGESSARHLRGESMADVIFNGSATRKPVGQASIELVFDNSAGKLDGPWARYNEISVKRLVTRDGQSSYFLNQSRCRRRDITDLFLGTGLGPRSYAIIEQGMISRLIESRPEELRVFLEEAAGISRYKERRRETETRIRHTRENLDRLTDLREELDRQLQHLQRQARSAEQYQHYRAEERRLNAELLALRWQALDTEVVARERLIREQETALEAVLAEQRGTEARLETTRLRREELNDRLAQVQARYYDTGMEITRLEQELQHQRKLQQRHREELTQAEQSLEALQKDLRLDEDRLEALEQALSQGQPALETAQALEAELAGQLEEVEAAMQNWQMLWEAFSRREADARRLAEREQTRIEHLQDRLLQLERRKGRLRLEWDGIDDEALRAELEELQRREREAGAVLEQHQMLLAEGDATIAALRQREQGLALGLNDLQGRLQAGRGRLASLETLQEAALGRSAGGMDDWLRERQLHGAPRLAEHIAVEPGWEQAVETVLGYHLQALCVADLEASALALAALEQGSVTLFETTARTEEAVRYDTLAAKVHAPWPLHSLLAGVGRAADPQDALGRRGELAAHESLITPDGTWLGRDWLRVARGGAGNSGVLLREREIRTLTASLKQDAEVLKRYTEDLERSRIESSDAEQRRVDLQAAVNASHREQSQLQGQVNALQARLEQLGVRRSAISEELEEIHRHTQQDQQTVQETRRHLQAMQQDMEQLNGERQALLQRREGLHSALEERRARLGTARHQAQQQALAQESRRTALASTRQSLARLHAQQRRLQARREQLLADLQAGDEPLVVDQARLEAQLEVQIEAEQGLSEARRVMEAQDHALRTLEQSRLASERQALGLRQTLENQRLGWGELRVRRQTLVDQLQKLEAEPATVLARLPARAEEAQWQSRLEQVGRRIQRLGAVNLAAIEECARLEERKRYLDAQNADLMEALGTLENAMRKIDRETRTRFKDTFDRVNQGLQGLFPRLFGGGQAYLQLSSEDLLDTGVAIMARPPGKRIGNIHLLSGGEKALTAVALVFALFQLNPAPFCMLDEVDAPLDEANVGRFGKLVKELAKQVQFILITHNKTTMEIAPHLAGVTMHEPGVSRLVAVDVDEAVRLAVA